MLSTKKTLTELFTGKYSCLAAHYISPYYGEMLIIYEREDDITLGYWGDVEEHLINFNIIKLYSVIGDDLVDITDPDTDAYHDAMNYINEIYS